MDFKPEGPWALRDLGDDLNLVVGRLESLGVKTPEEQVCVLGLSNGGRVALDFASRYSSKVSTLVVADCYGVVTAALRFKLTSWLKASELGGPTHRFDVATPWVWGESFLRANDEVIASYRNSAKFYDHSTTQKLIEQSLTGVIDLSSITCPILVMVGEEDVLTPISVHLDLVNKLKNARLEIIRGGHASLIEHPENIDEFVMPFYKQEIL